MHAPAEIDYDALTREEVEAAVEQLVRDNRARCLWFAPRDYMPKTDQERMQTLDDIEQYGDRATFVRSRTLRRWLSQHFNSK